MQPHEDVTADFREKAAYNPKKIISLNDGLSVDDSSLAGTPHSTHKVIDLGKKGRPEDTTEMNSANALNYETTTSNMPLNSYMCQKESVEEQPHLELGLSQDSIRYTTGTSKKKSQDHNQNSSKSKSMMVDTDDERLRREREE